MTQSDSGDEIRTVVTALNAHWDRPVAAAERSAATRCLIDTVGCGLAGASEPAFRKVAAAYEDVAGGAPLFGSARRLPVRDSLTANAVAIRALDYNDIYSARNNQHPSENVIPIALAHASDTGCSGAELVDIIARAYRMFLTLGESFQGLLGRGWAPSASLGRMSSAFVWGKLWQLTDQQLADAIGIAAVTAPTLAVVFRGQMSDAKSTVNGLAGSGGWESARLAQSSVTAPMDALTGPAGFSELIGGPVSLPSDELTAADVAFKAYSSIFMTHSAMYCAIELAGALENDVDAITAINVTVPHRVAEMTANPQRWEISTPHAAQFSLPQGIAIALTQRSGNRAAFTSDVLQSASVRRLVDLVEVHENADWTGYYPAELRIECSGEVLTRASDYPPGHPSLPMTDEKFRSKFLELTVTQLDAASAEQLWKLLAGVEELVALDDIMSLITYERSA